MGKKYYFILWIVLFTVWPTQLFGQTYNRIIPDKDYYDFINYNILNDSIKVTHHIFRKRIPLNPKLLYYKDSIDFNKKNLASNCTDFIFHYRVFNKRVFSNYLDTIFTRADIDFFGQQLDAMRKNKRWKQPFENSVLIDSVEYNYNGNGFFGREMKYGVWGYSLPLFSYDRTYVLIIKSNSVSLAHYIYKRNKNGGWDFIKEFKVWALDYF
jgi:hypothetical protein